MWRLFVFTIITLLFCCDRSASKNIPQHSDKLIEHKSVYPEFKAAKLDTGVYSDIQDWKALLDIQEAINNIGKTKAFVYREASSNEKKSNISVDNNSYQNLYYQIYALAELCEKLKKSSFPIKFNKPAVKSRITLIETYTLKLKDDMEYGSIPSLEQLTEKINNIYWTYNSFLKELNRINREVFNDEKLENLSKESLFQLLDSLTLKSFKHLSSHIYFDA